MSKYVIALSGGLDSTTTMAYLIHEGHGVFPVIFKYGQVHNREVLSAMQLCYHYKVPPIVKDALQLHGGLADDIVAPPLEEVVGHPQPITYVPFRNLVFLSVCLNLAEAERFDGVAMGFHRSDTYGYWDTTQDFMMAMQAVCNLNRQKQMQLWAPFLNKTKVAIAKTAVELGVPIGLTYSCYRGGDDHCGECATCRERFAALKEAGVM